MKKTDCEIQCNSDNYQKVIKLLEDYKIPFKDQYSLLISSDCNNDSKAKRFYGLLAFVLVIVSVYLSVLFLYWTQKVSYPMNIGGKGIFEFITSVPIIFEFTILITIVFLFVGFFLRFRMLRWSKESEESIIIYIEKIYDKELLNSKLIPIGAKIL